MTAPVSGNARAALHRQRTWRLEQLGLEIDRQRNMLRQPWVNDHLPRKGVLEMFDELAALAGDYQRPVSAGRNPKES